MDCCSYVSATGRKRKGEKEENVAVVEEEEERMMKDDEKEATDGGTYVVEHRCPGNKCQVCESLSCAPRALVEIYDASMSSGDFGDTDGKQDCLARDAASLSPPLPSPVKLCPDCLVGRDLPVYRPTRDDWHFGEVVRYKKDDGGGYLFLFVFLDGDEEWLAVDPTPFSSYLTFARRAAAITAAGGRLHDESLWWNTPPPRTVYPQGEYDAHGHNVHWEDQPMTQVAPLFPEQSFSVTGMDVHKSRFSPSTQSTSTTTPTGATTTRMVWKRKQSSQRVLKGAMEHLYRMMASLSDREEEDDDNDDEFEGRKEGGPVMTRTTTAASPPWHSTTTVAWPLGKARLRDGPARPRDEAAASPLSSEGSGGVAAEAKWLTGARSRRSSRTDAEVSPLRRSAPLAGGDGKSGGGTKDGQTHHCSPKRMRATSQSLAAHDSVRHDGSEVVVLESAQGVSRSPGGDGNGGGGSSRKAGPRMWTTEEDQQLLEVVQCSRHPMRWPAIARHIEGRTGKQCRERYLNHLKPRLKMDGWSPEEDALVFYLYSSCGSRWAQMSKLLPGRTDNGIKNRFHHLRRRLEKDVMRCSKLKVADVAHAVYVDLVRRQDDGDGTEMDVAGAAASHGGTREVTRKIRNILVFLAAESQGTGTAAETRSGGGAGGGSVQESNSHSPSPTNESSSSPSSASSPFGGGGAAKRSYFGPFYEAPQQGVLCRRCHLFAPSIQTGTTICSRTRWCVACTKIPPYVTGHLLRECLGLRRAPIDCGNSPPKVAAPVSRYHHRHYGRHYSSMDPRAPRSVHLTRHDGRESTAGNARRENHDSSLRKYSGSNLQGRFKVPI